MCYSYDNSFITFIKVLTVYITDSKKKKKVTVHNIIYTKNSIFYYKKKKKSDLKPHIYFLKSDLKIGKI